MSPRLHEDEEEHPVEGYHDLTLHPAKLERSTCLSVGAACGGPCVAGGAEERPACPQGVRTGGVRRGCAQGVRAGCTQDFCSTTSLPCLLGRYLKAYPGVDQTQGLNQGKVLPHVPEQRRKEGCSQQGGEEGRGGNEEPGEEGGKIRELPI